jgi:hypothetical protein
MDGLTAEKMAETMAASRAGPKEQQTAALMVSHSADQMAPTMEMTMAGQSDMMSAGRSATTMAVQMAPMMVDRSAPLWADPIDSKMVGLSEGKTAY